MLGLVLALGGCGIGGAKHVKPAPVGPDSTGPAADYPMVLGEPFSVDGVLYTPADTLNYDEVGHALAHEENGASISVAHRTLPLPSYVEVTSLNTGRTILARVERRGPMAGPYLLALSQEATSQLGEAGNFPARVRRVTPPEQERALLRSGQTAAMRMETPQTLLQVLKRRLPQMAEPAGIPPASSTPAQAPVSPASKTAQTTQPATPPKKDTSPPATAKVAEQAAIAPSATAAQPAAQPNMAVMKDGFVVQAGAFASKANADKVAHAINGRVDKVRGLYLARTGPFASRKEAEAALAKVQAKGYRDARIFPVR